MIERAIENWLTNTNEKNYQLPLCQSLITQGHKILYISPHGVLEQGKDIITIAPSGDYCAYQLKTGNIDLNEWRQIRGEVIELMEIAIRHPSVERGKIHKSFLVTNGEISDPVRLQITQLNEDNITRKRNVSPLDVICGKGLLKYFIDAQGEFLPKQLSDFELFLKLCLSDGKDFLPKENYFSFFNKVVFDNIHPQKTNNINAIGSSLILNSYLLDQFQRQKNHYALFEAWTSLLGSITCYAIKAKLDKGSYQESVNLITNIIIDTLESLKRDVLVRKDFLEGNHLGDGGLLYRARVTMTIGAICASENYLLHKDTSYKPDSKVLDVLKVNISYLWLWGESAFPHVFHIIKFLEKIKEEKIASDLLTVLLSVILQTNSFKSKRGLPSPYYSINDILETEFNMTNEPIDYNDFVGGSYVLESIIDMLVKRNRRDVLEKHWRAITYFQLKEFLPDSSEDYFDWRVKNGQNCGRFPTATQSWKDLVRVIGDKNDIPQVLVDNKDFLIFYIIACPHRANRYAIKLLDSEL